MNKHGPLTRFIKRQKTPVRYLLCSIMLLVFVPPMLLALGLVKLGNWAEKLLELIIQL